MKKGIKTPATLNQQAGGKSKLYQRAHSITAALKSVVKTLIVAMAIIRNYFPQAFNLVDAPVWPGARMMGKSLHITDRMRVMQAAYWLNEFPVICECFPVLDSIRDELTREHNLRKHLFSRKHMLEALLAHLKSANYKFPCEPAAKRYGLHGDIGGEV